MPPPLVLVVDDEPDLVELVTLTLSRMQLATQSAGDVATAKKLLKSQQFDLCLTDMRLPGRRRPGPARVDGLALPAVPCAVITAHGNVESAVRALKLGAFDFVSKPLDLGVLRRIVSTALKLSQSADAGATTRAPARSSSAMRRRWNDCASSSSASRAARRRCTSPANPAPARSWWRA